jgi:hypothetical protein
MQQREGGTHALRESGSPETGLTHMHFVIPEVFARVAELEQHGVCDGLPG